MKAFVMKTIGQVGFMEKPIPHPGPNDAIVKTTKALICTSDSHTVGGAVGPRENLTLGHEAVGTVHEVGSNVKLFKPGDRVLVGAITPDWGDPASQAGHSSQSGAPLGGWKFSNTKDGVFAEYFHVNEADANMARIPASVPDEVAVYCADMLSTGFMGAENGNIPIGGTVAVFAEGPVGLMATVGAKLRGAGLIIGVETVPRRQELARTYGADAIADFSKEDVVQRILDLTDGQGWTQLSRRWGRISPSRMLSKSRKLAAPSPMLAITVTVTSCISLVSSGESAWRKRPLRPVCVLVAVCAWTVSCACWR